MASKPCARISSSEPEASRIETSWRSVSGKNWRARAGIGPSSKRSRASRAGNGSAQERGPQGVRGHPGRSAGRRWLPSELDVESEFFRAAVDLERDRLAGVLRRDQIAELVDRAQRNAVRG